MRGEDTRYMWRSWRLPLALLLIGGVGYATLSYAAFAPPATVSEQENNNCGFNPADFTAAGQLRFSKSQAWGVSFLRKQEYFSALSIGLIVAFIGFATGKVRQIGLGAASGAVAGGGVLAVLTLCLGCLAPTLATVGLGLVGNLALPIPKWLMLLNTFILTAGGAVFLSRRARACPIQYGPIGSDAARTPEITATLRTER
jgi:hypothetical protein